MLIETPIAQGDVVTLKLVGGDEVLGRLSEDTRNVDTYSKPHVEIIKPMLVMMGQQGFGLMPYILTAGPDAKISINPDHIITMIKTLPQVSKEYIKQTTGLEI